MKIWEHLQAIAWGISNSLSSSCGGTGEVTDETPKPGNRIHEMNHRNYNTIYYHRSPWWEGKSEVLTWMPSWFLTPFKTIFQVVAP